ncbi:bifunctional helix-turn-helix transcriptional regulator/GNAT family N-acetyltransferase [Thalassospira australica]|uniref:bifunctional helix-turn-helix transcriptional regulator/GNAT family N-acetyltransferase n=1 Tax=Thalassospira australica TaxID=1528106 RepID=UPI00051A806A|nr:helix-turn-helix domain-containing GNAT family N-acetyltransferase [Thalassospira australica]
MNISQIDAIRAFNRFYTRQIGLLSESLHKSAFSLTEARVLFELDARGAQVVGKLAATLDLDPAYLSRILTRFKKAGLITLQTDSKDRRVRVAELTALGRETYGDLQSASRNEVTSLIAPLTEDQRDELTSAMKTIQTLLGSDTGRSDTSLQKPVLIRDHRPGDLGWIVHRQGDLYAREYQWDTRFEGLVADIAAKFLAGHDPKREGCWIAEHDGKPVGSIMLVRESDTVAKLRILFVEPDARGLGIGKHLVDHCIAFAKQAGYREITLWTNANLHAARKIYQKVGFTLINEEPHHSFGHDLIGQNWSLVL